MSHTCHSAVLTCIDFRFQEAIPEYLANLGVPSYDRISVAGATKNIAVPEAEAEAEYVLNQIDISVRLHNVQQIILMNHEDCGAYGGKAAFENEEQEQATHFAHMEKTRAILEEKYPEVSVKNVWARINDEGVITFADEATVTA